MAIQDTDLLIVGSGAAGLYGAWCAACAGLAVTVVTRGVLRSGSSYWAQGGIAAVTAPEDRLADHVADTLAAGRGLCDAERVQILVEEGAAHVAGLIAAGMAFDRDASGTLLRGLEGGHGAHRVLHAKGAETGRVLTEFLEARLAECDNVTIIERADVLALLQSENGAVVGAELLCGPAYAPRRLYAGTTLLATGGYAGLFARSTNPPGANGSGLMLAAEAGARLTDLEFVQFHPTAFYDPSGQTFLLTEALRGAGATLVDAHGRRFLANTPGAELAPRDVVAAAIHARCAAEDVPCMGLDLRHLNQETLTAEFGSLLARVAAAGIDITTTPIPVAPAAHYCIGGVATDATARSGIDGLYVAGETAATGVHGANRLASNSLLECLVFAARAVRDIAGRRPAPALKAMPRATAYRNAARADHQARRSAARADILMADVGLLRDAPGLARAAAALAETPTGWPPGRGREYHDWLDRGTADLSQRIVVAAAARSQSIGVHRRSDHALVDDELVDDQAGGHSSAARSPTDEGVGDAARTRHNAG
ncbi:L-aspartate oxidase [Salinisphaera japonica]|uniref:L-aspartate oxidase n=1 Tax=Salinisphaera japonica YTM-1 TaxID=1209778 RepID=A0A423PW50_9GAMM|nr:FAD-binding protein [Salinisphaera japonica]ROO29795.1 L-aspartate oxidase [Salinisphaera japonica YTM-1]